MLTIYTLHAILLSVIRSPILTGQGLDNESGELDEAAKKIDRALLVFIHGVFVVMISYLWQRVTVKPSDFDSIAIFLLGSFSGLLLISLISSVRNI